MAEEDGTATVVYIPVKLADKIRAFLREVWNEERVNDMIAYLVYEAIIYALEKEDFKEFYVRRALKGEDLDLVL